MGSCCGLVGRGVAYDTRGPQFKTSYGQNRTFVSCQLYIRDENKEKEAGNGLPIEKSLLFAETAIICLTWVHVGICVQIDVGILFPTFMVKGCRHKHCR